MSDLLLTYKALVAPNSIYGFVKSLNDGNIEANKMMVHEYCDFKEFLIDHYMDKTEYMQCYLKFLRWKEYTDAEIRDIWPELLEL